MDNLKSSIESDVNFLNRQLKLDIETLIESLQNDLIRLTEGKELCNIEYIYKTALKMNTNYNLLNMSKGYIELRGNDGR